MISYCITCHNRLWQLKQTLAINLSEAKQKGFEICLLDYGPTPELADWIKGNFLSYIESGVLLFYHTQASSFNAPHAKNIAALLATKKYIFNLDADNFIGPFHQQFLKIWKKNPDAIIQNWSGSYDDGSYGRIALKKDYFLRLGGYDESFFPMLFQDSDLLERSIRYGLDYHLVPYYNFRKPIFNTIQEKTHFTKGNYTHYIKSNFKKGQLNKWKGINQVNRYKFFGKSQGVKNFTIKYETEYQHTKIIPSQFWKGVSLFLKDFLLIIFSFSRSLSILFITSIIILWHRIIYRYSLLSIKKVRRLFIFLLPKLYSNLWNALYWKILYRLYSIFIHKVVYRSVRISKRILEKISK